MRLRQPWLWLVLAGCSWAHLALAQNDGGFGSPTPPSSGTTTTPGGTKPAASPGNPGANDRPSDSTPAEAPPPKPTTPTTPPTTEPGTKPANPFGFDTLPPDDPNKKRTSILTPGTGSDTLGPNGASSTFGADRGLGPLLPGQTGENQGRPTKPLDNAATYTAPGFFGAGQQSFTAGEGRFAKPRYRYGGSAGIGFDDNYQQAPDQSGREPTTVLQIIPAVPELSQTVKVEVGTGKFRPFNGQFQEITRTERRKIILRPFQPEQRIQVPVPGIPSQPRRSSVVSSADLYFNTQWAKSREALTFDLRLGAEYYFDREKDPLEYNGSLSMLYIRKLSSKMQFTANALINHQTQPDFAQVNVTNQNSGGAYTNGNVKFDLSYRWTPRFSTDTSLTSQAVFYDSSGVNSANSFYDVTLGNEFRYIRSRRSTYVAEVRYTDTTYLEDALRNSDTILLLLGLDQKWSRRLTSTVRLGEAYRTFQAGDKQTSPYGELTVAYQPSSRSQFTLSSRYGFEATQTANEKNITFRTSLAYARGITPRLSGNLAFNYVSSEVTSSLNDTQSKSSTFDGNLGLTYRFNRRFNLSARYSYTMLTTDLGFSDYDRSRLFFTGSYDF